MKKAIFAVLAVLGMLAGRECARSCGQCPHLHYLFPPDQNEGATADDAPPAVRCGRPAEGGSDDRDIPGGTGGADRRHPRLRLGEAGRCER